MSKKLLISEICEQYSLILDNYNLKDILKTEVNTDKLTDREKEIITFVIDGLSKQEIGKRIFISKYTVKTHLQNIYQKLKINGKLKLISLFGKKSKTLK